jgi:hypothetical protein
MIDWILRNGFSPRKINSDIKASIRFAQHYSKSPALLTGKIL